MLYYLLLPFTWLYTALAILRNHLYDIDLRKSVAFDLPVINVGNLTVGGTGKTPHVEYLIRLLLKNNFQIATLSRGYGRKTKGFLLANSDSTAETIGDESLQLWLKFRNQITVAVGEQRILAVPQILAERPDTQVILLDDAFQHRAIKPSLNILLTDYNRLFYKDVALPAGRLRESRHSAKRADVVIVTKCPPNLLATEKQTIIQNIQPYTRPKTPIFFSAIRYGMPQPIFKANSTWQMPSLKKSTSIVLVTGIAQPQPLVNYIQQNFTLQKHFQFPDHYHYQTRDWQRIVQYFQENATSESLILTTEKDFVKISQPAFESLLRNIPLFYQPMEIYFLENETQFEHIILENCNFVKA
ncbi:MAG: tetraacyldisaccharide 4'-kinase [Microscillaceae bacterium]|nr:tetraacyldisaccharide 4'-kinase [Microscillaceae bacterium]MDW8460052.1 tetraacyldisaccharide 4'-kinase [Cytophagales bacterium]